MDPNALVEEALEAAIARGTGAETPLAGPPQLTGAVRHAVFPGGARVRPQLCLAVASACAAGEAPEAAVGAAAAIELLHCASLVHDDMPCFDAADVRRGKPSVHARFGEPIALLAGDALIVMAFETLGAACESAPSRLPPLTALLAKSVGAREGLVAGQAWESEEDIDLRAYHQAKTGALFTAATTAGAVAAGAAPDRWRALGARLGEAYQIADDIRDFVLDDEALGKPAGQDEEHDRPSAVRAFGLAGALDHLHALVDDAAASVPDCAGAPALRALVRAQAARLTPARYARSPA